MLIVSHMSKSQIQKILNSRIKMSERSIGQVCPKAIRSVGRLPAMLKQPKNEGRLNYLSLLIANHFSKKCQGQLPDVFLCFAAVTNWNLFLSQTFRVSENCARGRIRQVSLPEWLRGWT